MFTSITLLALAIGANAAYLDKRQTLTTFEVTSTILPDYFQTNPELFPGPTPTGSPPFLAQSNPAPFGPQATFIPNSPLETYEPIQGDTNNQSIFQLMGNLSPYFPNPTGFGVDEFPLPAGAKIEQLHMIARHGSRYPTSNSSVQVFGETIQSTVKNGTKFTGNLTFLNDWSYKLGAEILVPVGRKELFDNGVLHQYQYGGLYDPSTKIIARTTSEDRIIKSAENFMAGFFGLNWGQNATLEVIIEQTGFNDTLAGYDNCNNSNTYVSAGGSNASAAWQAIYLQDATERLKAQAGGFNWTTSDTYNAQTLCPYETVAFGYSAFCNLFTFEEWQGFEYTIDLSFAGGSMFQSPTGRAVGIGFVEETLAILNNQLFTTPGISQANLTLDGKPSTFPLNQTLYLSFSHDTNIASVLTAFGLTQFAQFLPTTGAPANQQMIVSHLEPFGGRLDIEIISAPQPVAANRTYSSEQYTSGNATKYVHFIQNQRTIPLGVSFPQCGQRTDGWCDLETFLIVQSASAMLADYDYSCNGKYPAVPYGTLNNGVPQGVS
ncbi:MAG: hypothetical protein MMC33_000111 [Icmadophila ericetorum]|nr:hypothetical protein [Icmadophila ericetorum]